MSAHPLIETLGAACATIATGAVAIAQDIPIAPKDVGLLAIVSAIGAWLVKTVDKWGDRTTVAIEKSGAAQAEFAKQMALTMKEGEEGRRQILAVLADLPDRVAEHVKRSA